jgi:hypothetical protein
VSDAVPVAREAGNVSEFRAPDELAQPAPLDVVADRDDEVPVGHLHERSP